MKHAARPVRQAPRLSPGAQQENSVSDGVSSRASHEIEHGKKLSMGHPEDIWGWGSPAGKLRASRRAGLIARGAGLRPGVRALEIGCGTGLFTEMFAPT